ncbi:MAG TPA: hypothetical protein VFC63_19420 [Blastocatellia bacterium]|nr:hypothetical protein [Blastocatellia bacterium]
MAKSSGSKKSKRPAKKSPKKTTKGSGNIDRILKEIRRRNQAILKEARKIEDLLSKVKPGVAKPAFLAEEEPYCPPETPVSGGLSGNG